MGRVVSTQVRLPSELHEQLRTLAFFQHRSLNTLMVEALVRYLEQYKRDARLAEGSQDNRAAL